MAARNLWAWVAACFVACALVGGCASGGNGNPDGMGDGTDDGATDGELDVEATEGGDGVADTDGELDVEADVEPEGTDGDADGDGDVTDDGGPPPRECVDERCGDGLDNDCDGIADEDCFCVPGEVGSCFTGDPRRRGIGICRDGTMVCEGTGEFGLWGPCEGDGIGGTEVCDAAALDEDCDGAPNDGCECSTGDPDIACGTDVGECRSGVMRCIGGVWSECLGSIGPEPEECNTLDDDCDRTADEGLLQVCGSSIGACRTGYATCVDGAWSACEGGHVPSDEVCDALDNDCDTETDELVTRPCGITEGRCIAGVETCTAGTFGPCTGAVDPIGEECNGVDDDCDTETDEGLVRPCGTDVGI
jgi:hypothetical protein